MPIFTANGYSTSAYICNVPILIANKIDRKKGNIGTFGVVYSKAGIAALTSYLNDFNAECQNSATGICRRVLPISMVRRSDGGIDCYSY